LTPALRAQVIEDLLGPPPVVIVIGDGCDSPEGLSLLASRRSVTVLRSALPEPQLARAIAHAARSPGSAWQTLHGVFMQVRGLGVLLSGASGVGKSRLALELLDRGHSLVADDAPRFSCEDRHTLRGCCPAPLHGFVSVRGLGVLNVVTLFGQAAVQGECPLQLIVQLALLEPAVPAALDPLYPLGHWRIVLGVPVAQVWLPVTPLCHAAVLVESLVGNHLLKSRGYDVAADFAARQRRRMDVQYP
jgi:HPr kinase/phosphorylase